MTNCASLVRRYGVKRCLRSLDRVHGMDLESAWLAIWFTRHDTVSCRVRGMPFQSTAGVKPAPLSAEDAQAFLALYTARRGRERT